MTDVLTIVKTIKKSKGFDNRGLISAARHKAAPYLTDDMPPGPTDPHWDQHSEDAFVFAFGLVRSIDAANLSDT